MHSELEKWIKELSRAGALTASLNWYRANSSMKSYVRGVDLPNIKAPTLGIWSTFDAYLIESKMILSGERVVGPWRYVRLTGSHWVPLDQSEKLNELLIEFFNN